jgi:hypothetical protein
MDEGETVAQYFPLHTLATKIHTLGKKISDEVVMEYLLNTSHDRFLDVVNTIE